MDNNQLMLLKTPLDFIVSYKQGKYKFLDLDSEQLFLKNKKKLGKKWYWYNGPQIKYKINKQGFRMDKDFEDVNLDNYFLSIGCSFAFGLGMPYEELYTNLVAKETNTDSVLLANTGQGMDTFFHNFFVWVSRYKKLPKFVLLAHSTSERKTYWVGNNSRLYEVYTGHHINGKRQSSYKEYLRYESYSFFDYRVKHAAIKSFCNSNNIPLIEFSGFSDELLVSLDVQFLRDTTESKPLARDHHSINNQLVTHPGYDYQSNVLNYVKEKLSL